MARLFLSILLLLSVVIPATAQNNPELADSMTWFSCHWNGSIASGTVSSISISDTYAAQYHHYPSGVTVVSTVDTVVHLRTRATTMPTGTSALTVARLNTATNTGKEFDCYGASNIGTGTLITSVPVRAYVPVTIPMDGNRLNRGAGTSRNYAIHIDAAAGTAYITWKVGRK